MSSVEYTTETLNCSRIFDMIMEVWEVYKRDSQECCMFLLAEDASNQTVYEEVDLICQSRVDLEPDQVQDLLLGKPVF